MPFSQTCAVSVLQCTVSCQSPIVLWQGSFLVNCNMIILKSKLMRYLDL